MSNMLEISTVKKGQSAMKKRGEIVGGMAPEPMGKPPRIAYFSLPAILTVFAKCLRPRAVVLLSNIEYNIVLQKAVFA